MGDLKKRDPVERLIIANTLIQSVIADYPTQSNASNTLKALDCVSRQAAIDEIEKYFGDLAIQGRFDILSIIKNLPSAQPTLYGYSIEHLALIATIMQKEHVTPEKAIECFNDIGRIVQMIVDEQQEMIRRAMEGVMNE